MTLDIAQEIAELEAKLKKLKEIEHIVGTTQAFAGNIESFTIDNDGNIVDVLLSNATQIPLDSSPPLKWKMNKKNTTSFPEDVSANDFVIVQISGHITQTHYASTAKSLNWTIVDFYLNLGEVSYG